jgi:DNA-directed RNA polymerase specialized sigma24 family protein
MRTMDELALDELPRSYRVGLRMRDLGASDDLIADCLNMDTASVPVLLEIGARKLEQAVMERREHHIT